MWVETNPAEDVEPIGMRILVVKYERPERVGSIWLSDAWRVDHSRALWEVLKASPKAQTFMEREFGSRLEPDWILVTKPNAGAHAPTIESPDGRDVFMIFATDVAKVIPWSGDVKEMIPGMQILREEKAL